MHQVRLAHTTSVPSNIEDPKRILSNNANYSGLSSFTVYGTKMLLFTSTYEMPNRILPLGRNISSHAIDSGVFVLEGNEDKSSGTLSEVYQGKETRLVSSLHGKVQILTKFPFVWRRRSDFGGATFRAVSRQVVSLSCGPIR